MKLRESINVFERIKKFENIFLKQSERCCCWFHLWVAKRKIFHKNRLFSAQLTLISGMISRALQNAIFESIENSHTSNSIKWIATESPENAPSQPGIVVQLQWHTVHSQIQFTIVECSLFDTARCTYTRAHTHTDAQTQTHASANDHQQSWFI